MTNFTDESYRQSLYQNAVLKPQPAGDSDPIQHTMGASNFKKYIGRYGQNDFKIDTKKLSAEQGEMLAFAYVNGLTIHVVSAYRSDFKFLLEKNKRKLIGNLASHRKPKSDANSFNRLRQIMGFVALKGQTIPSELWVLAFPSKQYVNQTAELLQAILNDFQSYAPPKKPGAKVMVNHFDELENELSAWTGFKDFISHHVRHGDVVVIGNIDLILPGIIDYSFRELNSDYFYGGLDNIFGAKVLRNKYSHTRIILIGVMESFWGSASALYTRTLLDTGAMHILYGSKAASLIHEEDVHQTYTPAHFALIEDGKFKEINYQRVDISNLIENLNILSTGFAVTVPTVIGEDHEQRRSMRRFSPTCMDCENGYIASMISDYNKYITDHRSILTDRHFERQFVPIHFITDYIYNSGERIDPTKGNLSLHAIDKKYREKRDAAFRKIGNVFAAYALMVGIKNAGTFVEATTTQRLKNERSFKSEFDLAMPLLDAGLAREALEALAADRNGKKYRIVPAIVHAMICQKNGYISSAFTSIGQLENAVTSNVLTPEEKTRIEVISLKIYSQLGSINKMASLIHSFESKKKEVLLKKITQFGAVKRREAIFYALQNDYANKTASIAAAKDKDSDKDNKYRQTNKLFDLIAGLCFPLNTSFTEISNTLSEIRKAYLGSPSSGEWWQTNFEKSAVAALFVEAAYYLSSDEPSLIKKGARALTIAHLFNLRLGVNEVGETYGEIIACTKDKRVRNVLAWAMRKDGIAQTVFQRWVHSEFKILPEIAGAFKLIFQKPVEKRETEILKLLRNG